jgi:hypothetical protein
MPCADYSLFRERLREACKEHGTTPARLARRVGMPSRAAMGFQYAGWTSVDLYTVCLLADRLGVSLDWLLGWTDQRVLCKDAQPSSLAIHRCKGTASQSARQRMLMGIMPWLRRKRGLHQAAQRSQPNSVEEAGLESFPASDPPSWSAIRVGKPAIDSKQTPWA